MCKIVHFTHLNILWPGIVSVENHWYTSYIHNVIVDDDDSFLLYSIQFYIIYFLLKSTQPNTTMV